MFLSAESQPQEQVSELEEEINFVQKWQDEHEILHKSTKTGPKRKVSVSQVADDKNSVQQANTGIHVDGFREKIYNINDLKRRSSKLIKIPLLIVSSPNNIGLYRQHKGSLETTVKYKEFYSSTDLNHEVLIFPYLGK